MPSLEEPGSLNGALWITPGSKLWIPTRIAYGRTRTLRGPFGASIQTARTTNTTRKGQLLGNASLRPGRSSMRTPNLASARGELMACCTSFKTGTRSLRNRPGLRMRELQLPIMPLLKLAPDPLRRTKQPGSPPGRLRQVWSGARGRAETSGLDS